MKTLKLLTLTLIILTLPLTVFSSTTWEERPDSRIGEWEYAGQTYWKTTDSNQEAEISYVKNLTANFTVWDLKVKNVNIGMTGLGVVNQILAFDFGTDTQWVRVMIQYSKQCYAWLFGLFQGTVVTTDIYISDPLNYSNRVKVYGTASYPCVRVVFYRNQTDSMIVKILSLPNENSTSATWAHTQNYTLAEATFQDGYLEQHMIKEFFVTPISGYVEGQKISELVIDNNSMYAEWETEGVTDFWNALAQELWGGLTSTWHGITQWSSENLAFLGDLYNYMAMGLNIIVGLTTVLTQFLPYILTFWGLWIFGLGFTGIMAGSLDPILDHFRSMYELILSAIGTVVDIAQAIWNYIKFW